MRRRLSCVDAVPGSALPSTSFVSSTSLPEEATWPSSVYVVATCSACTDATTSTTFFYFATFFATSRTTLTSTAAFLFCLLSASWVTHSLASSFLFCAVAFSSSAKLGARHLGRHVSNTIKNMSSVAMSGIFVHYCARSFRALMYMLCISTLNSAKLCRLLCIVGDRHGLLLINIQMLPSMRTHKIFVSQICFVSLVAQSEAYFAASGKSRSIVGN